MKLIGIAGYAGSGKDTFADLLAERIPNSFKISLSDCIRTELRSLGVEPNRDLQRLVADHRRMTVGPTYWADLALRTVPSATSAAILVGVYAPAEAAFIKSQGGQVLWVDAGEDLRIARVQSRMDGPRDALASTNTQLFTEIARAEGGRPETSAAEVALSQVQRMADRAIDNSSDRAALTTLAITIAQQIQAGDQPGTPNLRSLSTTKGTNFAAGAEWSDDAAALAILEKTSYFCRLIGTPSMTKPSHERPLAPGMPLSEVVSVLYRPDLRSISGNQTAKRMAEIFEVPDPRASLLRLRAIAPSNQEEEYFCGLDDTEFFDLHLRCHVLWQNDQKEVFARIPEKISLFAKKDIEQFSTKVDRGLGRMRQEGVTFTVSEDALPELRTLASNPICAHRPILEIVKNDRIFEVAGFIRSKASLVIHDAIDHLWTFDLLDRLGLLSKYAAMFAAIGNPEKSDLFRREGEAVASISFGVRAFAGVAPGFRPLIGSKDIVRMVREMRGRLSDRHTDALRIVNNLASDGPEWRSLGYAYSNYLTELDEQRKTYGRIKYRNAATNRIECELDPGSPDYLCFFIETHHQLLQSVNKHRNALFCAHYVLEEYLRHASLTGERPRIALTPSLLDGKKLTFDAAVPTEVAEWMFHNYGFTTNRVPV